MKTKSLQFKIALPLIVLGLLLVIFFAWNFQALNIGLARINRYDQQAHELRLTVQDVYRMVQSGILTGETRYAIRAAQTSLTVEEAILELAGAFASEAAGLETEYRRYYAALISINSLFLEHRLTEAQARLNDLENHFTNMRDVILRLQERLQDNRMRAARQINLLSLLFLGLIAAAFLTQFVTLRRALAPARRAVIELQAVEAGDLTRRLPITTQDEVGRMAQAFNSVLNRMQTTLQQITRHSHTVAASATDLSAVSTQTAHSVQDLSGRTATVAAAAEQTSANTAAVVEGMGQATHNLASIASATEEMSTTVTDIASNTETARAISEQAAHQTQELTRTMQLLSQAVQEIGSVTDTISIISAQTNLLALNATIEAARAGSAGKGFAVVAAEIKELARQTTAATEDINTRISSVRKSAGSAGDTIASVTGVISQVSEIVTGVAGAIEEQAVVTRDIAANIAQATHGVEEAGRRVAETVAVSQTIATDIAGVDTAAYEIRAGGEQVQASAVRLSGLAHQLQELVEQFTVGDTADPDQSTALSTDANVLIAWGPQLSVGVSQMDDHHQKLVALINDLYAALRQKRGFAAATSIFKELGQYVQYHFTEEERLMQKAGYANLKAHRQAHTRFLETARVMEQRWQDGDQSVPVELMPLLQDWLVKHIQQVDKQYGPSLNQMLSAGAGRR